MEELAWEKIVEVKSKEIEELKQEIEELKEVYKAQSQQISSPVPKKKASESAQSLPSEVSSKF